LGFFVRLLGEETLWKSGVAFNDAPPRLWQAGFLLVHGVSPSLIEMFSPPAGTHLRAFFVESTQQSALSIQLINLLARSLRVLVIVAICSSKSTSILLR